MRRVCLITLVASGWQWAAAQSPPVRYVEGTLHGFLSLRDHDGKIVAMGDLSQVAHDSTVTARLVFHFRDGSLDDETTVFTEKGTFRLVSDHHIQRGPSFPKPMDMTIDTASGRVTMLSEDKDGKLQQKSVVMELPADLVNGLVAIVAKNIRPTTQETKVSMVVSTPEPRVVTLDITPAGEDTFQLDGQPRKGPHYNIQIQLGGVAGVVATLIGKHPPDIQIWVLGGDAPTFLRSIGQLAEDAPVWTMQLASPEWPKE